MVRGKPTCTCVALVALCAACAEKPETRADGPVAIEAASPGTGGAGGRAEVREQAAVPAAGAADQGTPPSVAADVFERRIDVSYRDACFAEVLDDLKAKTGLRSAYVRGTEKGPAFTFEAKGVPPGRGVTVREVLAKLARAGGLAYDPSGDVALLWNVRNEEVRRRLDGTSLSFEFAGTPVEGTIPFLASAAGVAIHIDERLDAGRLGRPINLKVSNMTCRRSLDWIMKIVDLVYVVRNGSVIVSSAGLIDTAELPAPRTERLRQVPRPPSKEVLALLEDALALPPGPVGRKHRVETPARGEEALARFLERIVSRRDENLRDKAARLAYAAAGGSVPVGGKEELRETARRVKKALSRAGKEARREALAALDIKWPKGEPRFLLSVLTAGFLRTRRDAVYALVQLPDEHALRYVEAVLDSPENRDGDRDDCYNAELREAAVSLLAPIGGKEALAVARRAFSDEAPLVRAKALRVLCEIDAAEALPFVEEALGDPEKRVRSAAAEELGKLGSGPPAGVERALSLLERALGDAESSVRAAAARGLAGAVDAVGRDTEKALSLLERALGDPESEVRSAAAGALGRVGGERALALLEDAQEDEDEWVRSRAGIALAEMGTDAAMSLLVKTLREPDEEEWVAKAVAARLAENRAARSLLMLVRILGMEALDYEEPARKEELRRALRRKVSFDFAATPLPEAMQFLQTLTKVTIILDPPLGKVTTIHDPRAFKGNDRAGLRVTLRATDVPFAEALGKLLRPAGLDYALRNEGVFVSTPGRLAGGRRDHSPSRSAALEALDGFRGNFVRDELIARAAVEPSVGIREDIVSRLTTFYGGDPAVTVALAWQATAEAEAGRARRRAEIRAERLRREGRPPPPHSPADSAREPGAVF